SSTTTSTTRPASARTSTATGTASPRRRRPRRDLPTRRNHPRRRHSGTAHRRPDDGPGHHHPRPGRHRVHLRPHARRRRHPTPPPRQRRGGEPVTDPKYAIDTDHGRYYEHPNYPGRRFVSITNVLDSIAKPSLVPAAVKITAETAVDLVPEIVASARVPECKPKRVADECGRCTPCMVKRNTPQHTNVWEHAADTGTLIHRVAEAHVTGAELSLSAEEWEMAQPYLDQYLKFLDDYEVDITQHVEAAELTVCHPELGLAG